MTEQEVAHTQAQYDITKADLPLCCPTPNMTKWDSHPQVFLTLEEGSAKCPYCGTEYVLVD